MTPVRIGPCVCTVCKDRDVPLALRHGNYCTKSFIDRFPQTSQIEVMRGIYNFSSAIVLILILYHGDEFCDKLTR